MEIYCDLWRSIEIYCDLLRSIAIYCDLLRPIATYCDITGGLLTVIRWMSPRSNCDQVGYLAT